MSRAPSGAPLNNGKALEAQFRGHWGHSGKLAHLGGVQFQQNLMINTLKVIRVASYLFVYFFIFFLRFRHVFHCNFAKVKI